MFLSVCCVTILFWIRSKTLKVALVSPRLSNDPSTICKGRIIPSGVYVLIYSKDKDLDPMSNTHALNPQPSILLRPCCPPSLMTKTFFTLLLLLCKRMRRLSVPSEPSPTPVLINTLQLLPDSIMIIASRRFCRVSAYKPRFFWPAR